MGRSIPSDYVGTGINSDIRLDDYVRCSRCGFINKLSRDIRARYGSFAGWGLIYVRQYKDTIINGTAISDGDVVTTTGGRITTESGFALETEDGRVLLEESTEAASGGGGNLTFKGDTLTFGGSDVNQ